MASGRDFSDGSCGGVLSGAKSRNEIEGIGNAFQGFSESVGAIPSHNTFNRVISALGRAELETGFVAGRLRLPN